MRGQQRSHVGEGDLEVSPLLKLDSRDRQHALDELPAGDLMPSRDLTALPEGEPIAELSPVSIRKPSNPSMSRNQRTISSATIFASSTG